MDNLDIFKKQCKEKGVKITPQRTAIYSTVASMRTHPSASEVYEKIRYDFPNISLDTVNRNLIEFCQLGIIHCAESSSGVKRFDGNIIEHHHFQCIKCNRIIDFDCLDSTKIPNEILDKYKIFSKRIVLSGICDKCISTTDE